jgi:hypothetical protein
MLFLIFLLYYFFNDLTIGFVGRELFMQRPRDIKPAVSGSKQPLYRILRPVTMPDRVERLLAASLCGVSIAPLDRAGSGMAGTSLT